MWVRSVGITITQKRGRCVTGNTPGEPAASPSVLKRTRERFYCPPAQRAAPPASLEPDTTLLLHCTHAAKTTCTIKRMLFNCSGSSHLTINFVFNKKLNSEPIKGAYRRLLRYFFLIRNIWEAGDLSQSSIWCCWNVIIGINCIYIKK